VRSWSFFRILELSARSLLDYVKGKILRHGDTHGSSYRGRMQVTRSMAVTVAPNWMKLSQPRQNQARSGPLRVRRFACGSSRFHKAFLLADVPAFTFADVQEGDEIQRLQENPYLAMIFPGPRAPQQHRGGLALIDLDISSSMVFQEHLLARGNSWSLRWFREMPDWRWGGVSCSFSQSGGGVDCTCRAYSNRDESNTIRHVTHYNGLLHQSGTKEE
jgi:hypothetical protein